MYQMNHDQFVEAIAALPRFVDIKKFTDWHWLIDERYDYYPTKRKWYDRRGVYGTVYNLTSLISILKNGARELEPGEEGRFRKHKDKPTLTYEVEEIGEGEPLRPLSEIFDEFDNLLAELRRHQ